MLRLVRVYKHSLFHTYNLPNESVFYLWGGHPLHTSLQPRTDRATRPLNTPETFTYRVRPCLHAGAAGGLLGLKMAYGFHLLG